MIRPPPHAKQLIAQGTFLAISHIVNTRLSNTSFAQIVEYYEPWFNRAGPDNPDWLSQCKQSLRNELEKMKVKKFHYCCGGHMLHDFAQGYFVCPKCGNCIRAFCEEMFDYNLHSTYNKNAIHHYSAVEHFDQFVLNFTATGRRVIDHGVVSFCRNVCGAGDHVTTDVVMSALRLYGDTSQYIHLYDIVSRLRHTPLFRISYDEMDLLKRRFRCYHKHIYSFQRECKIGRLSRRGKLRIFWPFRFILARLCEEIGRADLVCFIGKVVDSTRYESYRRYWVQLQQQVFPVKPSRGTVRSRFARHYDVESDLRPVAPTRRRSGKR